MQTIVRGLYAGLIAGLILAALYFVGYGPGNDLNGVANWFALGNKDTGKFIGFALLIILGGVFGLIFGLLQGKREPRLIRSLLTGLVLGVVWWVALSYFAAIYIGHMPASRLNFGGVLYPFIMSLVYGCLLGSVYFQISAMKGRAELRP